MFGRKSTEVFSHFESFLLPFCQVKEGNAESKGGTMNVNSNAYKIANIKESASCPS